MDCGKHVASASRISLAIMALGFTTLYVIWIASETDQTLRLYNQSEQILAARNTLSERPWNDGAEVTVGSLTEIDHMLFLYANLFAPECKRTLVLCEDEATQREYLFGLTLKEMQLKLPRARRFELTGLRSEFGGSCGAIFFRGKDEETFWIKGISSTAGVNQVQGSLIYYVRPSMTCRFSPLLRDAPVLRDAPAFFLIDLRSIGKGWNFHAEESVIRGLFSELDYRLLKNTSMWNEDWPRANSVDLSFETARFFEQLPDSYRKHFAADVPSKFLTVPVNWIESRIIGTAYMKTGTLYNISEIDKAIMSVYSFEKLSPTVGGFAINVRLFTSIAPLILLIFSFFFWYHVKRIVRSDSPCNETWIFLDAEGFMEKGFVTVWAALLVLTPALITWALFVIYGVSFPTIGQILAWVGLNRDPVVQSILRYSILSVPATLGGIVIVVGALLIIHSLHLLLERGSITYLRFWTRITSWFVKLVRLATCAVAGIGRRATGKPNRSREK